MRADRGRWLGHFYRSSVWRGVIGLTILVNSIVLGAITAVPEASAAAAWLHWADAGLLGVLVIDGLLCVSLKRLAVFRSGWDMFDITVTLISIIPSLSMISAFRVLRVIRVLRLISFVPNGKATVDAMLGALRGMTAAFMILGAVFYSFVVITTNLFRDIDPAHYGNLSRAAGHLYGIMVTLGSNLETETVLNEEPWTLPIFGAFIVVASFGLLNMFIAVIVAALREQLDQDKLREERAQFDRLERKLEAVAAGVEAMRRSFYRPEPPVSHEIFAQPSPESHQLAAERP